MWRKKESFNPLSVEAAEALEISKRKYAALDKRNADHNRRTQQKSERIAREKMCKQIFPKGHVYEWWENKSPSGGSWACVGCNKRQDGGDVYSGRIDKDGFLLDE